MAKGRSVLPPVILDMPPPTTAGYAQAMAEDEAFFKANPAITERRRPYVPGETPAPMPPGTMVNVKRIGYHRVRGFVTPSVEGN